jgi:hypothetical protein
MLSSVLALITVLNPQIPASTFTFASIDESPFLNNKIDFYVIFRDKANMTHENNEKSSRQPVPMTAEAVVF